MPASLADHFHTRYRTIPKPTPYQPPTEPDPNTLLVLLPGARIDAETERRVDTREFGGAVELFSIFQTPDISGDEVRVVLKRREPVGAELIYLLAEPGLRRKASAASEPCKCSLRSPSAVPPLHSRW